MMAAKQTDDIHTDAVMELSFSDSGIQEGLISGSPFGAGTGTITTNQQGESSHGTSSGARPKIKAQVGLSGATKGSAVSSRPSRHAQSLIYTQTAKPERDDNEYLQYLQFMPDELRLDVIDILIINAEEDQKAAEEFKGHLEKDIVINIHNHQWRPTVKLLEEIRSAALDHLDFAFSKTLYVFLYVTKTFCDDAWSLLQGQACLTEAIRDKDRKWCVIPIHTRSKKTQNYKLPMMLGSLRPINYWTGDEDQFYIDGVRKLLESKLNILLQKRRELDEERRKYYYQKKENIKQNSNYLKKSNSFPTSNYLPTSYASGKTSSVQQAMEESGNSSQFLSSLSKLNSLPHEADEICESSIQYTSLPNLPDNKANPDENVSSVQQRMYEISISGEQSVQSNVAGVRIRIPAGNEGEPAPSDINLIGRVEQQSTVNSTRTSPRNEVSVQHNCSVPEEIAPAEQTTELTSMSSVVVDGPASFEGETPTPYRTAAANHWEMSSHATPVLNAMSSSTSAHPTQAYHMSSTPANMSAAQPVTMSSLQAGVGFLNRSQVPNMGYSNYIQPYPDPFYARCQDRSMQQGQFYYPFYHPGQQHAYHYFPQQYSTVPFPAHPPPPYSNQMPQPYFPPSMCIPPHSHPESSMQNHPTEASTSGTYGSTRHSFPSDVHSNQSEFLASQQQFANPNWASGVPSHPVTFQTTNSTAISGQETSCKQISGLETSADVVSATALDNLQGLKKRDDLANSGVDSSMRSITKHIHHHHHHHRKEINVKKAKNVLIGDKSKFLNQIDSATLSDSFDDEDDTDGEIASDDEDDNDNEDHCTPKSSRNSERSHERHRPEELPSQSIPSADGPANANIQTSVKGNGTLTKQVDKEVLVQAKGFPECSEPASSREPQEVSETEEMKLGLDLDEESQTIPKQV